MPPRKPKYNGGVERSNRTFREEFYAKNDLLADTIGAFKAELKSTSSAVLKYNSYRPHQSIDFLTPFEYIEIHNRLVH